MSVPALIGQLRERDIRLRAVGDRLTVDAPRGALSAGLRDTLTNCKRELLAARRRKGGPGHTTPDELPANWRVEWEERAAVREYDGGQAREHAEAEALTEIIARMRAAGEYPQPTPDPA